MKFLAASLLLLSSLASAGTITNGVPRGSGTFLTNFVKNPSAALNTLLWTATNLTAAQDRDVGDRIDNVASFLLTSSTNLGEFCSDVMTLDDNAKGDGEFGAQWKGDGTKWRIELRSTPYAAANALANLTTATLTNSTDWVPLSVRNYPLTTALKLCVVHLGTGTDSLNVGNLTYRAATNIGTATLTQDFQPYTATLSNSGNATSSLQYARIGDSIYIKGRITIGSSLPTGGIIFSLPPGLTIDTTKAGAQGMFGTATGSTGAPFFPIGTLSGQTSTTIGILTVGANSLWNATNPTTWANGQYIEINSGPIPVVGASAQTVAKMDQTPGIWAGASTLGASTSLGAPGALTTSLSGAISVLGTPVNIACAATGTNVGIACTLPRTGNYSVCYSGYGSNSSAGSGGGAQLVDGSGTIIVGAQFGTSSSANTPFGFGGCGPYTASSRSVSFLVYGSTNSGGTATFAARSFSVVSLDQGISAPFVIGGVTSPYAGPALGTWAYIAGASNTSNCTGATCSTYGTGSGAWITTVTRNATGNYTFAIPAGIFGVAPMCTCGAEISGTTNTGTCTQNYSGATPTSFTISTGNAGTAADARFLIHCWAGK